MARDNSKRISSIDV